MRLALANAVPAGLLFWQGSPSVSEGGPRSPRSSRREPAVTNGALSANSDDSEWTANGLNKGR
eukprot:6197190-Pleurochrysis_carterae.AAC.1